MNGELIFCMNCGVSHPTSSPCKVALVMCQVCGMKSKMPYDALVFLGSGGGYCGCGADDRNLQLLSEAEIPDGHSEV